MSEIYEGHVIEAKAWGSKFLAVIDSVEQRYDTGKYAKLYRFGQPDRALQCARKIVDQWAIKVVYNPSIRPAEPDRFEHC